MEQLTETQIMTWLETISDPEIPVLSILDLGIVRAVRIVDSSTVDIDITPTYSGCPAMDVISIQIRMLLLSYGIKKVNIQLILHPAWTTDWMSEHGKQKLKTYGIAPPVRKTSQELGLFEEDLVSCPFCDSEDTQMISKFGATSCKSMHKCNSCMETFEHFKCH